MTESQFCAWVIFALPVLMVFGQGSYESFYYMFEVLFVLSIFPIGLFIIAENEFIKNCKKGYVEFEDSIFPLWFYKRWIE